MSQTHSQKKKKKKWEEEDIVILGNVLLAMGSHPAQSSHGIVQHYILFGQL